MYVNLADIALLSVVDLLQTQKHLNYMVISCWNLHSMSYQLKANEQFEYVHLTYSGDVDLAERQQAKDAVFDMCFEKNFHRSLVDLRESNIQMSQSDVVKFAASFKDTKLPNGYRLAGVIGPENESDNLIEIIISLDGINVKYFYDFQEAEDWLSAV